MKTGDFTDHSEVVKILKDLRTHFDPSAGGREFVVSDVVDNEGHQYVNLVQEGGGVLGVALVGYTYILEKMGVRFMSLAGTSAGAINTILISAIGEKRDEKSTAILGHLSNLNLFDFVDGFWFWRWLIKLTTTNKGFLKLITTFLTVSVALAIVLALTSGIVYVFFPNANPWVLRTLMYLTLVFILLVITIVLSVRWQIKKFYKKGWGLNPGVVFRNWVADIIEKNGVHNLGEWQKKIHERPADIRMRAPRTDSLDSLKPDVCLITSDITTQVKVEFPRMACLYWKDVDHVHPAEFVRASMSIPIFFETATVTGIPGDDPYVKKCWSEMLSYDDAIPSCVQMVDGGLLSNFPINVFFNSTIDVARLPTLGIKLDDSEKAPKERFMDFKGYLGAIFNTIRYYYDRDFLIKNSIYEKCIGSIDVHDFNWLNFNLTKDEKIRLFIRGAEAAALFLKTFDWEEFKNYRKEKKDKIKMK